MRPIDLELVLDSLRKTNRVVVAEEGWKYYGTGQGLAALIYEHGFDYLDAPIVALPQTCRCPTPSPWSAPRFPPLKTAMAVKAIVPARVGVRA